MIPLEVTPMIPEFTNVFPEDNALIPLEVIPVITEFTNVCLKDGTPIHFEVTLVIMKFINDFSEDLPDELPPMCDTQHIELVSRASHPDLPPQKMDPTMHI